MAVALAIIGLVAVQRLIEAAYAARNTRALLRRGAIETEAGHYPLFIALHAAWLVAIALGLPDAPTIAWLPLAVFVVLQIGRLWVIAALGRFWTTRIITLPGAPLVRRGPYRWVRHPNYAIVAGEIATLPLVFGAVEIAIVFSILNGALLAWRIRAEDRALAPRRAL